MKLNYIFIIIILETICVLEIVTQNVIEEQFLNPDISKANLIELTKNIRKRSLLEIFRNDKISGNKNENIKAGVQNEELAVDTLQQPNILNILGETRQIGVDSNISAGNITSPGYPGSYTIPNNANYLISLNPTLDLQLIFNTVDTRYGEDFIKINFQTVSDVYPYYINSSSLLLTGTFNQPLVFYARNYHQLHINFFTSNKLEKSNNSTGFILTYKILKTNLTTSDVLLLPKTTTILMSKSIKIPKNEFHNFKFTGKILNNIKNSFCDCIEKLSDIRNVKCDVENIAQDLIMDNCSDDINNDSKCVQIITKTSFQNQKNVQFSLTEGLSHNPHADILMWLAGCIGVLVIIALIVLAVIESNICEIKTKFQSRRLIELDNENSQEITNSSSCETHGKFCYENSLCNKTTEREENKSQENERAEINASAT